MIGFQLRLLLWVAGSLVDTSSLYDVLSTTSLLSNAFCLLSIVTLFALRFFLDGDPVFFGVLRSMQSTGADALEGMPPAPLSKRWWLACSTTGASSSLLSG